MSNRALVVIAGFFALLTLGASIVVPFVVLNTAQDKLANLETPLLALSGFMGVFACVALLVLAFKAMGLENRDQALGLPEGSVRALLAIFLVVTLGMTALFLLGPPQRQTPAGGGSEKTQAKTKLPDETTPQDKSNSPVATSSAARSSIQFAALNDPAAQTPGEVKPDPSGTKPKNGGETNKPQDTEPRNAATAETSQGGGDLTKQFLTLVGGLVTTVIGFYFGSQTASSANAKGAKAVADAMKGSQAQIRQPADGASAAG
jgi:hypothetical protein